ncbi:IclR family transcriptional regulator [Nocardioides bruguierae]|uniref:IclR family transcriptional regulator n=1 Tax=Nocardioides bruguierae TaxID=2945102 RepID=UPI00202195DE|nr:IclR family transcriptional regulator [Nocardioides bruguierae]MCL8026637.1 IclR family transcriptional regulator [Nocardioides bruguierae]
MSIQSVVRSATVLHLLGAAPEGLPLADLAAGTDLAKSTVHGLLRTLVEVGFVEQDPDTGRYRLGSGIEDLGTAVDPHLLRSRAMNGADSLAARTGLEVRLGVLAGDSVELVHHVFRPDNSPQRMRTGELLPLHATAAGLVLLAFSPVSTVRHRIELSSWTARTPTTRAALAQLVRAAQRRGWAVADETLRPGRAGLAAPVRQRAGVAAGALSVVGPREEVLTPAGEPRPGLADLVVAAADGVSETLRERR